MHIRLVSKDTSKIDSFGLEKSSSPTEEELDLNSVRIRARRYILLLLMLNR